MVVHRREINVPQVLIEECREFEATSQRHCSGEDEVYAQEQPLQTGTCKSSQENQSTVPAHTSGSVTRLGSSHSLTGDGVGTVGTLPRTSKSDAKMSVAAPTRWSSIDDIEKTSGVDRKGRHIPPGTMVMSHKGHQ